MKLIVTLCRGCPFLYLRITSYNVCYTKLLRFQRQRFFVPLRSEILLPAASAKPAIPC